MRIALRINKDNMDTYSDPAMLRPDWELIQLGNGEVPDAVTAATDAEVLVVDAITPVTAELIAAMPNLKIIHSQGVAFNRIDCEAAAARGIYVCNNAGVNATAVAEHTVMLMLDLLRRFAASQAAVYAGGQMGFKSGCFADALPELMGLHVGFIGLGAIGMETARRLQAFGCELCYNDRFPIENDLGLQLCSREEVLQNCDIVSLHVPVTPETTHMINEETLALMRPGAILINTARGELVDQEAIARALISGRLGGYGTDTLSPEPVPADLPLLHLPEEVRARLAVTPHVAGLTAGSFRRTYRNIWSNLAALQDGQRPRFIVNGV